MQVVAAVADVAQRDAARVEQLISAHCFYSFPRAERSDHDQYSEESYESDGLS
jgi:hypothetical protein